MAIIIGGVPDNQAGTEKKKPKTENGCGLEFGTSTRWYIEYFSSSAWCGRYILAGDTLNVSV